MANAFETLAKINFPAPSIVAALDALEKQLSLSYANASSPEGPFLGTFTASRRSTKPFIVGFIPPDNEVNFVPVAGSESQLASIGAADPAAEAPTSVSTSTRIGSGSEGELNRTTQRVYVDDLRQQVYDQYVKQTGVQPREATLRLLVSHIVAENGPAFGNPPSFPTFNFNLGNSHISAQGSYKDGYKTIAERKGKSPSEGIDSPPPKPGGGTYYLGTDYTGSNEAYPVYFTAFTSLGSAVAYQVNLIVRGWPGAAVATTEEEYIDALLHTPGRAGYFEANPDYYAKVLRARGASYDQRYGDQPLGTVAGPPPPPDDPDNPRGIMKYGVNEDDPLSSALGRPIQLADAERQAVALAQTDALRAQIDLLKSTPPLILLINPKTFARSYEASSDTSIKGRYGQIVHNWLERPFSLESEGVTAAQYTVDAEGSGGLADVNRIHSLSYANLLSLIGVYKNNGALLSGTEADRGIPILGMSVFIYYDEHVYLGSFDSFGVDDTAEQAFSMTYNFKFNVRYDLPTDGAVLDRLVAATLPF